MNPQLSSLAVVNRFPFEIWSEIFHWYDGAPAWKTLNLNPRFNTAVPERNTNNLRATCKALHQWLNAWEWNEVYVRDLDDLRYLRKRVKVTPGALLLIKRLKVGIYWSWSSKYYHDWALFGPPETFYFSNRAKLKKEFYIKHVIPPAMLDDGEEVTEAHLDYIWDGRQWTEGWDEGPQGTGVDPDFKDVHHVRGALEEIVVGATELEVLHYGTQIIPMSSQMCRALGRAVKLRVLSIGPSGEFFTQSFSQSPLWLIFEERVNKPLECLYLNTECLPGAYEYKVAEDYFQESISSDLQELKDKHKTQGEMFSIPWLRHHEPYLHYEWADDGVEKELSFVERPLAMLCRTLAASRGKLKQLQVTEEGLACLTEFLPRWAQLPVLLFETRAKRLDAADFEPFQRIRSMHQSLHDLYRRRLEQGSESVSIEEGELLDVISAHDELHPFVQALRGRENLQEDIWEIFRSSARLGVVGWERPALHEDDDDAIGNTCEMVGETYVRNFRREFNFYPDTGEQMPPDA